MTRPSDVAVAAALSMIGRPYVYGAAAGDTTSFDCSSLVQWAWGVAGVAVPRASIDQLQGLVPWRMADLEPGDLVFYDNALPHAPRVRGVNHVVMWIGGGRVVEASSLAGGVHVIDAVAKGRPLAARRPGAEGALAPWQYDVRRVVAMAGSWMLERNGRVTPIGDDAPVFGGVDGRAAAMAATPSGRGYWVAGADGAVSAFGDAVFHGHAPTGPAAMAATPSGHGYWLVDDCGRVSACGDAEPYGDVACSAIAMAMAATPTGRGYWVADAAGRVSAHGDAVHRGEPASAEVPVVAMASSPSGRGYWTVDAGGCVHAFGDAAPLGGHASDEPIVAMAAAHDGYRLVDAAGRVVAFEAAEARA